MRPLFVLVLLTASISSSFSCDNDVIVQCEIRWEMESKEAGNNEQKTCESAVKYLSCIEPYEAACFDPDRLQFNTQLRSYAYGERCFVSSSTVLMGSSTVMFSSLIHFLYQLY